MASEWAMRVAQGLISQWSISARDCCVEQVMIARALDAARADALEEAAKVAEGTEVYEYEFGGYSYDDGLVTLANAAAAIRALKREGIS